MAPRGTCCIGIASHVTATIAAILPLFMAAWINHRLLLWNETSLHCGQILQFQALLWNRHKNKQKKTFAALGPIISASLCCHFDLKEFEMPLSCNSRTLTVLWLYGPCAILCLRLGMCVVPCLQQCLCAHFFFTMLPSHNLGNSIVGKKLNCDDLFRICFRCFSVSSLLFFNYSSKFVFCSHGFMKVEIWRG